jgi:hypothetical protein
MKRTLFVVLFLSSTLLFGSAWKQIETVHTTIIFEEQETQRAMELASFADEVYEELALLLENPTTKRVPVILFGRTAWANGMYAPFPSSITLYLGSDEDQFLGAKTPSWLKSVYTHELTHYLHLTKTEGLAKILRFLGPGVASLPVTFMPGWWVEGITTYVESMNGEEGRGNSLKFALLTQKPIDEESMWSLGQGAYSGVYPPSSRIYATGYLVVEYLIRNYGFSAFNEINRSFAAFPFMGLGWIFKKVIGLSANELFELAIEERIHSLASPPGALYTQVKDGSAFLPSQTRLGVLGVVSSPKEGTFLKNYTSDKRVSTLPISKASALSLSDEYALYSSLWVDGTSSNSIALGPEGYSDLFLYHLRSGVSKRLTNKQRLLHPRLSKDGNRAIASMMNGSFYDLVEVSLFDGSIDLLLHEEETSFLDSALSKDGSKIVTVQSKNGNTSLVLVESNGSRVLIGPTSDELGHPYFLDDTTILFTSEGKDTFTAYRFDVIDNRLEELFTDESGIFGLTVVDNLLLYETAVATGRAVRGIEYATLEGKEAFLTSPRESVSLPTNFSFEIQPYHDTLRFNLALPYPFKEGDQWRPGVLFHTSSLLRKHTLLAQVGMEAEIRSPYGEFTYQYNKGRVLAQATVNVEKQEQSLGLQSKLTLLSFGGATYLSEVNGYLGGEVSYLGADTFTGFVNYGVGAILQKRGSRNSDFFGPAYLSSSVQMQHHLQGNVITLGLVNIHGQVRLGPSSVMLNGSVDYFRSNHLLTNVFLPIYEFMPKNIAEQKIRFGAQLRIPLTLLDLPFLYGGFTGLGLEVGAQTTFYPIGAGTFVWEQVVGFEAKLTANYALAAGADLKFFASVQILTDGRLAYSIGIDGLSLF